MDLQSFDNLVSADRHRTWTRLLRGLLVLGVIFLLREASALLLPITIAVALMFVLTPAVQFLRKKGISEAWGAGIVVSALILFLALFCVSLATPAAQWLERAPTTLQQLLETLDKVRTSIFPPKGDHVLTGPPDTDTLKEKLATEGLILTRVVVGQVLHFSVSAASTIILLYFLLASQHWLLLRTVQVVKKPRQRALLLSGIRQAQKDIGRFLGTMGLINIGLGICTGVALAFIGLPNPILWATIIAVLNFIPYFGPALLTVMLLVAGSMTFGTELKMLAPSMAFLTCHAIEANMLSPVVMGHRLRLSPLSVFLSVMLLGWIWGLGGALVAVPILLGFRAFCQRRRPFKNICFYLEGGRRGAPSLRVLLRSRDRSNVAPQTAQQAAHHAAHLKVEQPVEQ